MSAETSRIEKDRLGYQGWSREKAERYGYGDLFPRDGGITETFALEYDEKGRVVRAVHVPDFNDIKYIEGGTYKVEMDKKIHELLGIDKD